MRSSLFLPLIAGIVYAQVGQVDTYTPIADRQRKQTCLQQCEENDVDCKAICDSAPHPKPIHMNLMTECVQHCDVLKGDGSAVALKNYGACHDSCIGGYMNLGNSQAAPTTKTWVDLVTPTSHKAKAASETGSAAGNNSAIATPGLGTTSGLISTASSTGNASNPSATGQSRIIPVSTDDDDEKAATSGAARQIVAAGSLIGSFVVGMIML